MSPSAISPPITKGDQPSLADLPKIYNWSTTNERGYSIIEQPSGTRRLLRVVVLGAGASGINFSKFAEDSLPDVEVQIYDKNSDVGGTWLENRYPGCACDIPSVTYQFTWEPAVWSKYYSESKEIYEYFAGIVQKYKLRKYMKLLHRVDKAEWNEEDGKWIISITDLANGNTFQDHCDVFLNAGGPLNFWEWPKINGLKDYKGIIAHSAAYPEGLDLRGKRVAVVGNGSSGVQIVAKIQETVAQLYTWIRSPTWMTAGFAQKHAGPGGTNFEYSEEQKRKFADDPAYYLKYRKSIETEMSTGFMAFHKGTPEQLQTLKFAQIEMAMKLQGNQELAEALIPKTFPVGCKRPTPGNGYLESIIRSNVTNYLDAGLETITESGFLDPNGNEQEVDVIILATGFNTTWVPRFPILSNGSNLQDVYADKPISYLGLAAPQVPNYFTFYGPYGPLGQGSALPMIEYFSRYFINVIKKMQLENIKSVTPKQGAADDFAEHADLYNKRTVWDGPCRSWFKGGQLDGRIMLHPGTRTQYMEMIDVPRYEDYDIKYRGINRWQWLGNGFSVRDYDGRDLTWYMGLVDGEDKQRDFELPSFTS